MRLRVIAAAVGILALGACSGSPRDLPWQVRFTDTSSRARATALAAAILEGDCDGRVLWSSQLPIGGAPIGAPPPDLGPGSYAFSIAARDSTCTEIAAGCEEIDLPLADGAPVIVELMPLTGLMQCPEDACREGICDAVDGGGPSCPFSRADCNRDPADGCEVALGTLDDCSACGAACRLAHATSECRSLGCAIASCEADFADCNSTAADGCETSLATLTDCGDCGAPCDLAHASETCASGTCALGECHPGCGNCDGVAANGCETDLTTATHCGGCILACTDPAFPLCGRDAAGARICVAACPPEAPVLCGTTCTTADDPNHCGSCTSSCAVSHAVPSCSGGICGVARCDEFWGNCDGVSGNGCETSLTTASSCGACGTPCGISDGVASCPTGTCVIDACNDGTDDCDGLVETGCESDLDSATTCGSCTETCSGATPVCARSSIDGPASCMAMCVPPAPVECGDRCISTERDVANCGGCGVRCSLPNATVVCIAGDCRVAECIGGFGDCDGVPDNGCETELSNDPFNCGACGMTCPPPASGGEPVCSGGECDSACPAGMGDCDGDTENGCETDLRTMTDCGSCGRPCLLPQATSSCTTGTCEIVSCTTLFGDCDGSDFNGCETSLSSDRRNCGMCGFACMGGGSRRCVGGTCR